MNGLNRWLRWFGGTGLQFRPKHTIAAAMPSGSDGAEIAARSAGRPCGRSSVCGATARGGTQGYAAWLWARTRRSISLEPATASCTSRSNTYSAGRWRSSGISGAIGPSVRIARLATPERLQRVTDRVRHRRGLVAAMRHAVGAFLVVPGAIAVPVGGFHQLLERRGVALAKQIAGALPAEDVAGRVAPGRAAVLLIAGQKIQVQGRVVQTPALAPGAPEDVPEQLLGLARLRKCA